MLPEPVKKGGPLTIYRIREMEPSIFRQANEIFFFGIQKNTNTLNVQVNPEFRAPLANQSLW